jgi:hypothetical protein
VLFNIRYTHTNLGSILNNDFNGSRETYHDFNASLGDLGWDGQSLEERCLLWTKTRVLGRDGYVQWSKGTSLGRGGHLKYTENFHVNYIQIATINTFGTKKFMVESRG